MKYLIFMKTLKSLMIILPIITIGSICLFLVSNSSNNRPTHIEKDALISSKTHKIKKRSIFYIDSNNQNSNNHTFDINKNIESFDNIYNNFKKLKGNFNLRFGGKSFKNASYLNVAIIIPSEIGHINRMKIFLNNIHSFLSLDRINYGIYFVEPFDSNSKYNKGILMNIGFIQTLKLNYDCFIFHDINAIPLDKRISYRCSKDFPLHLASSLKDNNFDAVISFTESQFLNVNGFSNSNSNGNVNENEILYMRCLRKYQKIAKLPPYIGRFLVLNYVESDASNQHK